MRVALGGVLGLKFQLDLPIDYTKGRVRMRLTRHENLVSFTCAACHKDKKSKLTAEAPEGIICNGCFGQKLSEGVPRSEGRKVHKSSGVVGQSSCYTKGTCEGVI